MTIRAKILSIKGKPPKGRKPVRCNSAAEAQAIKHQWAMENAVRTLGARVEFLADQLTS